MMRFFALALALALGMLAPLEASAANVALPRQALGTSLQQLAKQSGIQIIFFSKVVEGREAPELNGTFTPEAALDRLLAGTDLTYHALNERTIEVSARAPVVSSMPWEPLPGSEPPSQEAPDAPIAEVEITAERARLSEMHAQIVRLENQFYARYNQANPNHQYDVIVCRSVKYTDSHVDRRTCGPASGLVIRPYLDQLPNLSDKSFISYTVQTPRDPEKLRAYRQNMVDVVRQHPELLELIKERSELVERYQAARYAGEREPKTTGRLPAVQP